MAATVCTTHPDVGAVGKCSRCEKPYCLDCLDIESGKPLCKNCLAGKPVPVVDAPPVFAPPIPRSVAPTSAPVSVPAKSKSQEDTFISMDDLNMGTKEPGPAPLVEVAPVEPVVQQVEPVAEKLEPVVETVEPVIEKAEPIKMEPPAAVLPTFKPVDNDPLGLFKNGASPSLLIPETPKPSAPKPLAGLPVVSVIEKPKLAETPFVMPASSTQPFSDKPADVPNFDLAGMMNKLDAAEQEKPKGREAQFAAQDKVSSRDLHAPKNQWVYGLRSFVGALWLKVDILAAKFKIPGYLLAAIVFVVVVGGGTLALQLGNSPTVVIVNTIPVINIFPIDAAQVPDLDITVFTDLQKQLGDLGFNQVLQMSVPQIPSPNFFDVGLKQEEGTYSEILKMPNQIGPRVAFVTVFTNGVWYSTNGWTGTNQQLDYLVSEFYPDQAPKQLYDQHVQGVQKLLSANSDWQVQKAGMNRYMSALTDHLRWFVTMKGIVPYQADFAAWH